MNLSNVSRKKAFLGNITTSVRNEAWKLCRHDKTILDVCCGNGLFFLNLQALNRSGDLSHHPQEKETSGKTARNISSFPLQEDIGRHGKKVLIGIDRSDDLLKEAKRIFRDNAIEGVDLMQGNAFQLPFKSKAFDRVVCVNTLLNLPSLDAIETLILELMRVCKVGGKLLIDIRNRRNPYIRWRYRLHAKKENFPIIKWRIWRISFAAMGFLAQRLCR
ncbi:MAG: class I SAM-dependent methyltransferase [Planctomycetes bacterium]|nr:class I SAM-dependent methyltransferase [Planctomycetota bacterium]